MFIALLIIARTAHIGATILLAGTFTFKLITLGPGGGSDDFHDLQLCLLHLALWSLVAAFLSSLLWFWLEVANMSGCRPCGLFPPQRGRWFCLKRNSVTSCRFASDSSSSRLHSSRSAWRKSKRNTH